MIMERLTEWVIHPNTVKMVTYIFNINNFIQSNSEAEYINIYTNNQTLIYNLNCGSILLIPVWMKRPPTKLFKTQFNFKNAFITTNWHGTTKLDQNIYAQLICLHYCQQMSKKLSKSKNQLQAIFKPEYHHIY